jgi:hypothetical protein
VTPGAVTSEEAIFALISRFAGLPVVFANENGPRPPKPYIQLRVQAAQQFPLHRGAVDDAGEQPVTAHRDASVELQCFGQGAYDALDTLAQRLRMDDALAEAEALDLAVFDIGKVSQLPVLRDASTYEPRGVLELGIRYAVTLVQSVGVIEKLTINSKLVNGAVRVLPFDLSVP